MFYFLLFSWQLELKSFGSFCCLTLHCNQISQTRTFFWALPCENSHPKWCFMARSKEGQLFWQTSWAWVIPFLQLESQQLLYLWAHVNTWLQETLVTNSTDALCRKIIFVKSVHVIHLDFFPQYGTTLYLHKFCTVYSDGCDAQLMSVLLYNYVHRVLQSPVNEVFLILFSDTTICFPIKTTTEFLRWNSFCYNI